MQLLETVAQAAPSEATVLITGDSGTGKELIAANIRKVAELHQVPMVEAPMLARAIYFNTELQQQIPAALFLSVAQLLAYVFQLRAYQDQGGDIPTPPQEYPVPPEYQHD